jgi:tRNA A-37 threonylcarbamoyl transferase component Bud32/tetratricopeptide (TPR) repeat protein
VEVGDNDPLVEILCSGCGSHFSLVEVDTTTCGASEARTVGHFQLLQQLGRGAFGSVWKARDQELDRVVAIKLPHRERLDEIDAERFLREARAAAQLRHAGIVAVHEVGRDGGQFYIVSEFIHGATLREWLDVKAVSFRDAAQMMIAIAGALDHAHQHGVVHRDLKPANILVDQHGAPHIADFGLAKRDAGELTMTLEGQVLGTPAYMSPEQARGEGHRVDARSDVYSLGVILFELLTGELPFRGTQRMLTLQILHDEPPSPRKLNGHIPKDLETITLKCLAKEPNRRYQTAGDLAADLRRFLNGEPIHARPVSRVERVWRWCRRRPTVAILTIVVIGLLIILAAAFTSPMLAGVAIAGAVSLVVIAVSAFGAALQWARLARRERQARTEAEAAFRQARQAVEEMLTEVGQEWLNNVPQMEPVRRTLLEKALHFYERFVQEKPTDPVLRRDAARARHRLADIYTMLGQREQARQAYRETIALLETLAKEFPDQPDHRHYLAISYDYLAELYRISGEHLEDAEPAYRRALDLQAHLAEEFPAEPKHRQELSRADNNLGIYLQDSGRLDEAEGCFREATRLLTELAGQFPLVAMYRDELARTQINLGVLLKNDPHRTGESEAAFRRAIELLSGLVREHAESRDYRYKLAVSRLDLGNLLLRDPDRREDAAEYYLQAREALEKLTADFPSIPQYREELANSLHCLASVFGLLQCYSEAEAAEKHAIGLFTSLAEQSPKHARYQSLLAIASGGFGWLRMEQDDPEQAQHFVEEAIVRQRAAVAANPQNPDFRSRLAEHYSFLAEIHVRQGRPDQAVAQLREATAAGTPTPSRLQQAAFEPLRSRNDFQQLLADFETVDEAR